MGPEFTRLGGLHGAAFVGAQLALGGGVHGAGSAEPRAGGDDESGGQ